MTLVRDGQAYSVGFFGGGVEDAVQGNPVAEEHASTFKTLMIAGWALYIGGVGSGIGGVALLSSAHNDSGNEAAGTALALGGVAAVIAGGVLFANAQPRIFDAVNAYNDGIDAALAYPMLPPPGLPSPPGAPNTAPPPAHAPSTAPPADMPAAPIPEPAPSSEPPQH